MVTLAGREDIQRLADLKDTVVLAEWDHPSQADVGLSHWALLRSLGVDPATDLAKVPLAFQCA